MRWSEADLARVRGELNKPNAVRRKYGNEPEEADGFKFDSRLEVQRYFELKALAFAGLVTDLRVHPEYGLHAPAPSGMLERVGAYIPEFTYMRDGKLHVEDCKSSATRRLPTWRWKIRHFGIEYGLAVIEISRKARPA